MSQQDGQMDRLPYKSPSQANNALSHPISAASGLPAQPTYPQNPASPSQIAPEAHTSHASKNENSTIPSVFDSSTAKTTGLSSSLSTQTSTQTRGYGMTTRDDPNNGFHLDVTGRARNAGEAIGNPRGTNSIARGLHLLFDGTENVYIYNFQACTFFGDGYIFGTQNGGRIAYRNTGTGFEPVISDETTGMFHPHVPICDIHMHFGSNTRLLYVDVFSRCSFFGNDYRFGRDDGINVVIRHQANELQLEITGYYQRVVATSTHLHLTDRATAGFGTHSHFFIDSGTIFNTNFCNFEFREHGDWISSTRGRSQRSSPDASNSSGTGTTADNDHAVDPADGNGHATGHTADNGHATGQP